MTVLWGIGPAKQFMKGNGLHKIVRAHQLALDGYEFPFRPDESVVTLFTASDYAIEMHNKAAFMVVSDGLVCSVRILPPLTTSGAVASRGRSHSIDVRATGTWKPPLKFGTPDAARHRPATATTLKARRRDPRMSP
jgi:hypothetical protein